jgi:phosphoserine phosphatase
LFNHQWYQFSGSDYQQSSQPSINQLAKLTKVSFILSKDLRPNADGLSNLDSVLRKIDFDLLLQQKESADMFIWDAYADALFWRVWFEQENIVPADFDYLRWPEKHHSAPKLLVFDMDSTFIKIEVIDELARRHGVGDSVAKVTEAAMRGELDFSASLISRVACLRGLAESSIQAIADDLPLSAGVDCLVKKANEKGTKITIVSGGFTPFVEHLKRTMDLYKVKANNLQIVDGLLTGKVLGKIVDAKAKADFVNELKLMLAIAGDDILTIGDGANDLLMMKQSGFSLAYRAKPAVQAEAGGRMNKVSLAALSNIFDW